MSFIIKRLRRSSSDTSETDVQKPALKRVNLEKLSSFEMDGNKENMGDMLSEISSLRKLMENMQAEQLRLKCSVDSMNKKMCDTMAAQFTEIQKNVKEMQDQITLEFGHLTARMDTFETRLGKVEDIARNIKVEPFSPEVTIVAFGVSQKDNENPKVVAEQLVQQGVGLQEIPVVRAIRLGSRNGKSGVLKIELASKENKIEVLQNKTNLALSQSYRSVFLRSSQTHAERLIQLNFKTILQELPNGTNYHVTGNGRLVRQQLSEGRNRSSNFNQKPNVRNQDRSQGHYQAPSVIPQTQRDEMNNERSNAPTSLSHPLTSMASPPLMTWQQPPSQPQSFPTYTATTPTGQQYIPPQVIPTQSYMPIRPISDLSSVTPSMTPHQYAVESV